jgi:aminoglycoside phosphotransferase family enzyme
MNDRQIRQWMQSLPGTPRLIETHISYVVLTDEFAYKVKKPRKYSFLDFSSVAKRKHYCICELELNSRLAPVVYLAVVPLCMSGHDIVLRIDKRCPRPIDHALKMKRLDASLEMDRMLDKGQIAVEYMTVLATKIAAFHSSATIISNPQQGAAASYRADFNDILGQAHAFAKLEGEHAIVRLKAIVATSDHYLETHDKLITTRLKEGFVRDVHGDLHSRNIFAYPDPVIFDCIEFNDHFRQIDVLNEVAFLCMDLEAMGFDGHAAAFLKAYLALMPVMRDRSERMLFTWFKLYRANVRAKVNALRARQSTSPEEPQAQMLRYLRLMERYAEELEKG